MEPADSSIPISSFTLEQAAQAIGVEESMIKFWEKEFDQIKPRKNRQGERFFSQNHIDAMKHIHHLISVEGLTTMAAKRRLQVQAKKSVDHSLLIAKLENISKFLKQLKSELEN